ncbi:MAG: CDP-alcohol phosphatidyltransferase family protein [Clostridiaceae bacterium]|jgi:cardiolipin synthase|nr:CDP-alcohol phosphatidyltransferase family protein [Clostridiaceae bacterium]
MNVPNFLTLVRFAIIPVFAYYLCTRQFVIAVILFLVGGFTDVLDGYIARKCNLVTSWGKIADPMADKLMQLTALFILTFVLGLVPVGLLLIVIAKEALMGIGTLLLYKKNDHVVSASWYGKLATVIFYLAIVLMLFEEPFGRWSILGVAFNSLFFVFAVAMSLFAFFMYARTYAKIRHQNTEKS